MNQTDMEALIKYLREQRRHYIALAKATEVLIDYFDSKLPTATKETNTNLQITGNDIE